MIASDAVAALRPRPSGPPLRGRAPLRDGIMEGRLVGRQNTEQGTAGSTLSSPIRGLRLGVGAHQAIKLKSQSIYGARVPSCSVHG
ncbi:hypothetical protein PDESU_01842 [Pontiella desulfatans]|uniref:Uncharacterized protein n=1 Tax=Pontiella desulfatans TaxID=2750659 RepID=A0A6C2U1M4_PONDE|nr:hypothetical protein PDESU_01842 [Pontiella desulfatans]